MLLTFTGTGGNVLGLTTLLRPVDAVACAAGSHVNADEAGAMERIAGAKLIDLPAPDGKLVPEQLRDVASLLGHEHHVQPAVVSITQEHRARHGVHRCRGRRASARQRIRWG